MVKCLYTLAQLYIYSLTYGRPTVIYGISLAQDYLFARFLQML